MSRTLERSVKTTSGTGATADPSVQNNASVAISPRSQVSPGWSPGATFSTNSPSFADTRNTEL